MTNTPWEIMEWNTKEIIKMGAEMKAFDWDTAAWLIRINILYGGIYVY